MRYILVDRIVEITPGHSAHGYKNVTQTDEIFEHHFPGRPIMPGCLILEALAQLSGLLLAVTREFRVMPMLLMVDKTKFRRVVRPGDQLALETELISLTEDAARFRARASIAPGAYAVGERTLGRNDLAAESLMTLAAVTVAPERGALIRAKFAMLRDGESEDMGATP